MSSLPNKALSRSWMIAALAAISICLLSGCIADTAEDSDLPWSRNQGWEGMIPLPYGATGQND